MGKICRLKGILEKEGFVHIKGDVMRTLILGFGGQRKDLELLESGIIHENLPADQQPIMRHRLTATHR